MAVCHPATTSPACFGDVPLTRRVAQPPQYIEVAMLKEVVRLALFPAVVLSTTCAHPRAVEFRGTPLSAHNETELARAVRRVAGDHYDRIVVTVRDRVVAVRR
jgi:hypothetical protein